MESTTTRNRKSPAEIIKEKADMANKLRTKTIDNVAPDTTAEVKKWRSNKIIIEEPKEYDFSEVINKLEKISVQLDILSNMPSKSPESRKKMSLQIQTVEGQLNEVSAQLKEFDTIKANIYKKDVRTYRKELDMYKNLVAGLYKETTPNQNGTNTLRAGSIQVSSSAHAFFNIDDLPESFRRSEEKPAQAADNERFKKKIDSSFDKNSTKKCRTCTYRSVLQNGTYMCNYILIMNHSRPCEPGDACTCYKRGEQQLKRSALY